MSRGEDQDCQKSPESFHRQRSRERRSRASHSVWAFAWGCSLLVLATVTPFAGEGTCFWGCAGFVDAVDHGMPAGSNLFCFCESLCQPDTGFVKVISMTTSSTNPGGKASFMASNGVKTCSASASLSFPGTGSKSGSSIRSSLIVSLGCCAFVGVVFVFWGREPYLKKFLFLFVPCFFGSSALVH